MRVGGNKGEFFFSQGENFRILIEYTWQCVSLAASSPPHWVGREVQWAQQLLPLWKQKYNKIKDRYNYLESFGNPSIYNVWYVCIYMYTIKRHFYAREKFMQICQNGPLDKYIRFLFMRSSTSCRVTYGTIKIYVVQIYATCAWLA